MTNRKPPAHDLDAEASVISAVFLAPDRLYDAQVWIRSADDFYSDANRRIWIAIEAVEREGHPVDSTIVAGWLRDRDQLQAVGGMPYIAQLIDATPAVANVGEHARIVAGHAHRRRLVATLQACVAEGYGDVGDPYDWSQSVEQRIYEGARIEARADEDGSLARVMPEVVEGVTKRYRGDAEAPGTPTGFRELDRRLNGLKESKVYVVAGRPGMGKSALIGQIATSIAARGMFVVEISTEQGRVELGMRKLSQATRVPYKALESGRISNDDLDLVASQAEQLRKIPLVIESMAQPTIARMRATIRRALAKLRKVHGERPLGVLVLDQIQHFDGERRRGENRESEVSRLSREIAWMAGEFKCPILLAAQLNRGPQNRPDKRPVLSDLRDSGALEQDAFAVLFPFRPKYHEIKNRGESNDHGTGIEECEIIVAKNKNGPGGSVEMLFHAPSMAFDDVDPYAAKPRAPSFEKGPPPDDPRFQDDGRYSDP